MLRRLTRLGFARGAAGGSRAWLWVSLGLGALRFLRRVTGWRPDTVYCERLRAGEKLIISHLPAEKR